MSLLNHYTSGTALEGIIQDDGLIFRATRFSHFNDSQEYRWNHDKLLPFKEQLSTEFGLNYDADSKIYPYVICFCDLYDELLMWKLYGLNGSGFILSLDYEIVGRHAINPYGNNTNPDILQPIVYADDNNWMEKFRTAYKRYCKYYSGNHSNDLEDICALVKRHIYKFENEIRYLRPNYDIILSDCSNDKVEFTEREDEQNVMFHSGIYGITPYIEIKLPKNALKSITVGYAHNFEAQQSAIRLLLTKRGYNNIDIINSKIEPYI